MQIKGQMVTVRRQRTRGFGRVLSLLAGLLALMLLLAACGGGDGGGTGGGSGSAIEVEAKEYEFVPSQITAPAGKAVIHLTNGGAIEHDIQFRDREDYHVYAAPGQDDTLEVEFAAGTYEFYCSIPGHEALGMVGSLKVE